MDTTLSHRECVELVAGARRRHTMILSVDGWEPVAVVCFVGGVDPEVDLIVPTGGDPLLYRIMVDQPVGFELGVDSAEWTVTGTGLAVRLRWEDRLTGPVSLRGAFGNALWIRVARFTGYSFAETPPIPSQRSSVTQDSRSQTQDSRA